MTKLQNFLVKAWIIPDYVIEKKKYWSGSQFQSICFLNVAFNSSILNYKSCKGSETNRWHWFHQNSRRNKWDQNQKFYLSKIKKEYHTSIEFPYKSKYYLPIGVVEWEW